MNPPPPHKEYHFGCMCPYCYSFLKICWGLLMDKDFFDNIFEVDDEKERLKE
jgi:hypothetical protein